MRTSPDELIKAANSIEFLIWERHQHMVQAYLDMTNGENIKQVEDGLREFRSVAKDLQAQIKTILERWQCPTAHVVNVNARVRKQLDLLWLNFGHYFMRFQFCKKHSKAKELTALYYLLSDLVMVAAEAKAEWYYARGRNSLDD